MINAAGCAAPTQTKTVHYHPKTGYKPNHENADAMQGLILLLYLQRRKPVRQSINLSKRELANRETEAVETGSLLVDVIIVGIRQPVEWTQ